MSTVHLHIGQCGNQLSIPLWQNFMNCKNSGTEHIFQSLDGWNRSIHIDSELKVVKRLPKLSSVREKNVILGKRGRGTNFALGYHGMTSSGDDHILDHGIEAIRKEIERCDTYSGIIVYHSISGGTGSGVGAHIIELLRDNYPCNHIMSCAVFPCKSGESPLQNYNALLALHWLQTYSDCVVMLQNDSYISYLKNLLYSEEAVAKVSFKDINIAMANNLSGVFLPTSSLSVLGKVSIGQEPWELVRTLTPMPATKFINLSQHVSSKMSWEDMMSKVISFCPKYNDQGIPNCCISGTIVARGDSHNTFTSALQNGLERKIKKSLNFFHWNPYPLDCWTSVVNTIGSKKKCSLTLATNSSCFLEQISNILEKSQVKFEAGAYLHWYNRYGISQEMFSESMETLQTIISSYKEATRN